MFLWFYYIYWEKYGYILGSFILEGSFDGGEK